MIYIKSFKNYDEFKQLFGVVKHGNGVVSRKNKILLACLKDRKLFHWWLGFKEWCDRTGNKYLYDYDYLRATNMDDLKAFTKSMVSHLVYNDPDNDDTLYRIHFDINFCYVLYSTTLSLDDLNGICTDGDSRSIRYENKERGRIFKMKAGKFITRCIEECRIPREYMPEQLKRWIGEEFARDWQVYAEQRVRNDYTLHVDDDFEGFNIQSLAWDFTKKANRDMKEYLHMQNHHMVGNFADIEGDYPAHITGTRWSSEYAGDDYFRLFPQMVARLDAAEDSKQADEDRACLMDWYFDAFGTFGIKYNFQGFLSDIAYRLEGQRVTA